MQTLIEDGFGDELLLLSTKLEPNALPLGKIHVTGIPSSISVNQ
jgi:hypothetical protein